MISGRTQAEASNGCHLILPPVTPPCLQLESDEVLQKVTTEDQRSEFLSQLNDMEDWLYGDGDAATALEYRSARIGAACCDRGLALFLSAELYFYAAGGGCVLLLCCCMKNVLALGGRVFSGRCGMLAWAGLVHQKCLVVGSSQMGGRSAHAGYCSCSSWAMMAW